ncbi:hypothetical protein [Actinacidiphila sp. ITFR-21]|uniref:wHTH domain-containing protein n=1 Tax=Actinacidiphila sp. ITFR-21 TaxID=3075199 RepID=UPI003D80A527
MGRDDSALISEGRERVYRGVPVSVSQILERSAALEMEPWQVWERLKELGFTPPPGVVFPRQEGGRAGGAAGPAGWVGDADEVTARASRAAGSPQDTVSVVERRRRAAGPAEASPVIRRLVARVRGTGHRCPGRP